MSNLLVIPDVVLDRLRKYFKTEQVDDVLNRSADLFGGVSALDYVRAGHSWEEVLAAYDKLFGYAVSA